MYRIVDSLNGPTRRHVGRYAAVALGVILLAVAFAAGLVVLTLVSVVVLFAIDSGELTAPGDDVDLGSYLVVVGLAVLSYVLWRVGIRLVRGDRHLVLFLRKFGFTGASAMLSSAIASGLGRRWRLVTLDDNDAAPIGVGKGSRWLVRLLRLALVAALIYFAIQGIQWLGSGVGDSIVEDLSESSRESAAADARAEGASEFEVALAELFAGFAAVFVGALVAALVVVFGAILIGVVMGGAAMGGLMLTAVGRSARRAERAKAIVIAHESAIERSCERLRRRTDKVLAPRITIARVADRLWQKVVSRLAEASDAVVIDVSFPTANLVWEVDSMLRARAWIIPVGRMDRLAAIPRDPAPAAVQLTRLLEGREVVAYDPESPGAFSAGLHRSLEVVRERVRQDKRR